MKTITLTLHAETEVPFKIMAKVIQKSIKHSKKTLEEMPELLKHAQDTLRSDAKINAIDDIVCIIENGMSLRQHSKKFIDGYERAYKELEDLLTSFKNLEEQMREQVNEKIL